LGRISADAKLGWRSNRHRWGTNVSYIGGTPMNKTKTKTT
jgi:hypothetical protein